MDVVFVHIPKTGGTALRNYLESALQNHVIIFDYGKNSDKTSPTLKRRYEQEKSIDIREIYRGNRTPKFLSGHFRADRYVDQFAPYSFVSIIREPFDRAVSEYNHKVSLQDYKKDFQTFIRQKPSINKQYNALKGLDLEKAGLILCKDYYDYGVAALNGELGIGGKPSSENIGNYAGKDRQSFEQYRAEFAEMNEADYTLYNSVRQRMAMGRFVEEVPTRGPVRGKARIDNGGRLFGWLASECGKAPLQFDVTLGDAVIGEGVSDMYRRDVSERGILKHGICGFEFDLAKRGVQPSSWGELAVRERDSGYVIVPKPPAGAIEATRLASHRTASA